MHVFSVFTHTKYTYYHTSHRSTHSYLFPVAAEVAMLHVIAYVRVCVKHVHVYIPQVRKYLRFMHTLA